MTSSFSSKVFRFAPSPNGYLHVGHAFSALLNDAMARREHGRLLLRLEDIDAERCRPQYDAAIIEDLRWLGVGFEEPVRRQSQHFDKYSAALDQLVARGLLYPCFCSRGDVLHTVAKLGANWPRDPDGAHHYPGLCRCRSTHEAAQFRALGRPAAHRLDMARARATLGGPLQWRELGLDGVERMIAAAPQDWGDPILSRKDIPASYHIAVVVDDALQGVTDVVRGADLLQATSLHRLLQALLDLPEPRYRHHALLRDAAGHKLSKSLRAKSLRSMRAEGASPADVRRVLASELDAAYAELLTA